MTSNLHNLDHFSYNLVGPYVRAANVNESNFTLINKVKFDQGPTFTVTIKLDRNFSDNIKNILPDIIEKIIKIATINGIGVISKKIEVNKENIFDNFIKDSDDNYSLGKKDKLFEKTRENCSSISVEIDLDEKQNKYIKNSKKTFKIFPQQTQQNQYPEIHYSEWWLEEFKLLTDYSLKTEGRALIFQSTIRAVENGYYVKEEHIEIPKKEIQKMQKKTEIMNRPPEIHASTKYQTEISVLDLDCLDAAETLLKEGFKPAVLNMANSKFPGGNAQLGYAAQEASIFRRTTYFASLDPEKNKYLKNKFPNAEYEIPSQGIIYSPEVKIIRKTEEKGYEFQSPKTIDLIACSAIMNGRMFELEDDYQNLSKEKIRCILRSAFIHKNDALVLGAFGCGEYKNRPETMASFFNQILQEKEFKGVFKKIIFAVMTSGNDNNNFVVFDTIINRT